MKFFNLLSFATIIAFSLILTSCDKDDPEIPNEEELITTVNFTLTPVDGGDSVTMSFEDLDGDGEEEPVIVGGTLSAFTVYNGSLDLLNKTETPAESVTEEIEEEDDEHQFFFETTVPGLTVVYSDADDDDFPVGLLTSVSTGDVGSGTLTVTLKHEPVKDAEFVAQGDITNAQGETDIQVTFPVNVQ